MNVSPNELRCIVVHNTFHSLNINPSGSCVSANYPVREDEQQMNKFSMGRCQYNMCNCTDAS